jgi:hypothetical protein
MLIQKSEPLVAPEIPESVKGPVASLRRLTEGLYYHGSHVLQIGDELVDGAGFSGVVSGLGLLKVSIDEILLVGLGLVGFALLQQLLYPLASAGRRPLNGR